MREVYPGRLVGRTWRPAKCELNYLRLKDIETCLKQRPLVVLGDSLAMQLGIALRYMLFPFVGNAVDSYYVAKIWNPSSSHPFSTQSKEGMDHFEFLSQRAKVGVISMGMWDMGVHFCSTDAFYDGFKEEVLTYKAMMQPGAQIMIHQLHWLHFNKSIWVDTCNPVAKIQLFREMTEMVSACTGIGIFDSIPVTRQAHSFTGDGVHFEGNGMTAKLQLFLNMMCDDPLTGSPPIAPYHPSITCDEEAAKARWRKHEIGNSHSPGCTFFKNKFGCPLSTAR
eukprot:TRINITY_DN10662_c0_g1_i1.p1 TRINITY_DN10662_c0_g1~~TRINITY_DN10662_c0_g1_i1.p1  ORF type:complete len:307 (+),score=58.39 TRINITY_DN10662_c0_g1_i1:84-923(+)